MRGLLLIGILIALAVVGYLQSKSVNVSLEADAAENKIEQVEQEVNAVMQEHMESLKSQAQQE
jgi:hypothetical protein